MVSIPGKRLDPVRAYKFAVFVDGFHQGTGFSQVEGIGEETEVIDYREGIDGLQMRRLPGLSTFTPITLSRGVSYGNDFADWRYDVTGGLGGIPGSETIIRRGVQIIVQTPSGVPVKGFQLQDAWPSKLEFSALNASSNEIFIETLTLQHEGLGVLDLASLIGGLAGLLTGTIDSAASLF